MDIEQMIAFYEALRKETRETLNNRYLNPANKARLSGELGMTEMILDHLKVLAKNLPQAAVSGSLPLPTRQDLLTLSREIRKRIEAGQRIDALIDDFNNRFAMESGNDR